MRFSLWLLILAPFAMTCDCDKDIRERIPGFNAAFLEMTDSQRQASIDNHFLFGLPTLDVPDNEITLVNNHFVTIYDPDLRVPLLAGYRLTDDDIMQAERLDCFRPDPRLTEEQNATCTDYSEPFFDRGHIVPRADMNRSTTAMANTYLFTNMAPQFGNFNRGIWAKLEGLVREWTQVKGELYILTGSIFDRGKPGREPDDKAIRMYSYNHKARVAVPTHFYKILIHRDENGKLMTQSFLLKHVPDGLINREEFALSTLRRSLTTIDKIESMIGMNILPELEESQATKLESRKLPRLWPLMFQ